MSAEVRRDILEIEQIRQTIETELARRHNWGEQEKFWRDHADFLARETRLSRARNYIAVAAIAASVTAACIGIAARFL